MFERGLIEENKIVNERIKVLKEKYADCYDRYPQIAASAVKTLMTWDKQYSTYGRYIPDEMMRVRIGKYKTYLTNNEEAKTHKYYFDENDRVILVERYADGKRLNLIFYFYNKDNVDIIMFNIKYTGEEGMFLYSVGWLDYENSKVVEYLESAVLTVSSKIGLHGYFKYNFLYEGEKIIVKKNGFCCVCSTVFNAPDSWEITV